MQHKKMKCQYSALTRRRSTSGPRTASVDYNPLLKLVLYPEWQQRKLSLMHIQNWKKTSHRIFCKQYAHSIWKDDYHNDGLIMHFLQKALFNAKIYNIVQCYFPLASWDEKWQPTFIVCFGIHLEQLINCMQSNQILKTDLFFVLQYNVASYITLINILQSTFLDQH